MTSTSADLFDAIEQGDTTRVRTILAADPTLAGTRDREGVSALMRARYRMDKDLIQMVQEHLHELDIFEASTFGDLDRLTELLAYDPASVVERSGDGFTALHFAAFFGGPEVTSFLVTRGSQVDAHGTGWMTGTPLHSAASSDHVEVARVLLDAGAELIFRHGRRIPPALGGRPPVPVRSRVRYPRRALAGGCPSGQRERPVKSPA